jgi:hypothetical protein
LCVHRKRPGCHPTCKRLEKVAPPHLSPPRLRSVMVAITTSARKGAGITKAHVRFGSKADICSAKRHVRFTPKSGHVNKLMSALGQKRTFAVALAHVRYGPGREPHTAEKRQACSSPSTNRSCAGGAVRRDSSGRLPVRPIGTSPADRAVVNATRNSQRRARTGCSTRRTG